MLTAASKGMIGCDDCGFVQRIDLTSTHLKCSRCAATMHARKTNSISRTWALVIAAYVLIIPANLMPVMATGSLFGTEKDTIFGGVVYLWTSDSEVLAMILFTASIIIPFGKLFTLSFLLISVIFKSGYFSLVSARLSSQKKK